MALLKIRKNTEGCRYSSEVEGLPSTCEPWVLNPLQKKRKEKENGDLMARKYQTTKMSLEAKIKV